MTKHLLSCLLLCCAWSVQAQKLHAVYEYIPSSAATFREHVYFEKGTRIAVRDSVPVASNAGKGNEANDEISSSFSMVLNNGTNYRNIVIQKNDKKSLIETRSLEGKNYLVTDKFPGLVWNTDYSETDSIGKFVCRKATAEYRGTTLIAYYTDEIPVPAGPYKFGGLPGLIVMLHNESANPNYWLLQELNYPYSGNIPVNEKYINSLPKLSLEEYVRKEEAQTEQQMRIMQSKMPVIDGVTVERHKVRGAVEQVYEWEQVKAK
ncbi:GLPGLI family protein [Arcticibacter tournemirensis]|uniref:GLPGLI family protein n=1 Tax=Arcticibacter tournemirensis TaxID=699437 RepID=A0A4Q0M5C6_9SPHI|nr:GLPGLI family protein [Arcticibacter tournemirensis]RXF68211.1 GLPGLI family protein [Arcticibacter tournemirensis]